MDLLGVKCGWGRLFYGAEKFYAFNFGNRLRTNTARVYGKIKMQLKALN
jgi:hypothetical protein